MVDYYEMVRFALDGIESGRCIRFDDVSLRSLKNLRSLTANAAAKHDGSKGDKTEGLERALAYALEEPE